MFLNRGCTEASKSFTNLQHVSKLAWVTLSHHQYHLKAGPCRDRHTFLSIAFLFICKYVLSVLTPITSYVFLNYEVVGLLLNSYRNISRLFIRHSVTSWQIRNIMKLCRPQWIGFSGVGFCMIIVKQSTRLCQYCAGIMCNFFFKFNWRV